MGETFQFATCAPNHALWFLELEMGKHATAENLPKTMRLIEADVLRVQDPKFHQPCQIVGGKNWSEARQPEIDEAIKELEAVKAMKAEEEAKNDKKTD